MENSLSLASFYNNVLIAYNAREIFSGMLQYYTYVSEELY